MTFELFKEFLISDKKSVKKNFLVGKKMSDVKNAAGPQWRKMISDVQLQDTTDYYYYLANLYNFFKLKP